jgi:hypothetical protein
MCRSESHVFIYTLVPALLFTLLTTSRHDREQVLSRAFSFGGGLGMLMA